MLIADAQCVIPTDDLQADIPFFTKTFASLNGNFLIVFMSK